MEWITNIRVAQNALDSTFTIYIFLGEFSSDPNAWLTEKSVVGSHTVFIAFLIGYATECRYHCCWHGAAYEGVESECEGGWV